MHMRINIKGNYVSCNSRDQYGLYVRVYLEVRAWAYLILHGMADQDIYIS